MASTTVSQGAAIAIKRFSDLLIEEILKETVAGQFVGTILHQETDLENLRGEQITIQLSPNLNNVGLGEGTAVDGNEVAITFNDDTLLINELSNSVLVPTTMSMGQKRVGFSHTVTALSHLKKWFTARFDGWFFNQAGGNTSTSFTTDGITFSTAAERLLGTGNNVAIAPSTNRVIRAGGVSNDESLTSTNVFSLSLIDAAVEKAKTATPFIAPVNLRGSQFGGRNMYVNFISEEQLTDLYRDTSSPVQVVDISLSELSGGDSTEDNFLVTAQGFAYRETLLVSNTRIADGVSSAAGTSVANTKRSIFCGDHAVSFAFAGGGLGQATFYEEFKNGGKQLQITGNLLGGMKKTVFDSEDYGVISVSSYAAPHTS